MRRLSDFERAMFLEQINVSTQRIQELKEDGTTRGTEEFYKHGKRLEEMKLRLELFTNSQKNVQEINEVLSKLYNQG